MCRLSLCLSLTLLCLTQVTGRALATDRSGAGTSPDGKFNALIKRDGTGISQLYLRSAGGSSPRQMTFFGGGLVGDTTGQGVLTASWSPDAKHLAILVHYTSCQNTVRALEEGYNETTLMVLSVRDLATEYLGGVDPRYSNAMIDLSEVTWADNQTVQFSYRMCGEAVSAGTKARGIDKGQMLRASQDFFGPQTVAHWLAEMIANRTPLFTGSCPARSRKIAASHIADPTLWIMGIWKLGDWDENLGYAVQIYGDGYQGDYFVLKDGRITDFISPG